jgi:hypothetical protein
MKLNITLDLEGFSDGDEERAGYSIEQAIIKTITEEVKNKLDIKSKMEAIILDKMTSSLNELISEWSSGFLENYLNKEIIITDDYGREKFKGTIRDKVHKAFDNFLLEKVDANGQAGSYGCKYTRTEFFIHNILKSDMENFTKNTIKEIKDSIKDKLSEELKMAVGKGVVDGIGINKLIENIKTA